MASPIWPHSRGADLCAAPHGHGAAGGVLKIGIPASLIRFRRRTSDLPEALKHHDHRMAVEIHIHKSTSIQIERIAIISPYTSMQASTLPTISRQHWLMCSTSVSWLEAVGLQCISLWSRSRLTRVLLRALQIISKVRFAAY